MNKSREVLLRRTTAILAAIGIVLMLIGGLVGGGATILISGLGAIVCVAAWGVAVALSLLARRFQWLALLAGTAIVSVILGFLQLGVYSQSDQRTTALLQVAFLAFAFGALITSLVATDSIFDRAPAAMSGALALIVLIVGGVIIGGAIGNNQAGVPPRFIEFGFHLYLLSGIFAVVTWILGSAASFLSRAWGWFALAVLLPGIGGFMFGLFGPTRLDVKLAQEDKRARRVAGVA
ncbi:MAG: hypothetical protein ABI068_01350 [Ktedonobacterales bacterium]